MLDVIVIGAGPIGLACGIAAKRRGLDALLIEKGALVNSLIGYPTNMEFFSTPDLLEIGGHPLPTAGYKPIREEALDYYRRVAAAETVDRSFLEPLLNLSKSPNARVIRVAMFRGGAPSIRLQAVPFMQFP